MLTIFNRQHAHLLWRAWQAETLSIACLILEMGTRQAEGKAKRSAWTLSRPSGEHASPTSADELADCLLILVSGLFNHAFYTDANPDVPKPVLDAVTHYRVHGGTEGRAPGPAFDGARYLSVYADIRAADMNPLLHFIKYGAAEGRLDAVRIHQPPSVGPRHQMNDATKLANGTMATDLALLQTMTLSERARLANELRHRAQAAWTRLQEDLAEVVQALEQAQSKLYTKNVEYERSIVLNDRVMTELSGVNDSFRAERERAELLIREVDRSRSKIDTLSRDLEDANREIVYWRRRALETK